MLKSKLFLGTSDKLSLTVRQANFGKIYFSSGKIIAVHVTFYLNSSITEVLLAAHVSWHVPHLDNCFDICHTSLNWQMLPACAPPTPANKSQHKLKHSTFYCSFMEVLEFIVFYFVKCTVKFCSWLILWLIHKIPKFPIESQGHEALMKTNGYFPISDEVSPGRSVTNKRNNGPGNEASDNSEETLQCRVVSCLVIRDLFVLPPMSRCHEDDGGWHRSWHTISHVSWQVPRPVLTHFNTRSAGKYEDNMTHPDPATSSAQHHHMTRHMWPGGSGCLTRPLMETDQKLIKCWLVPC